MVDFNDIKKAASTAGKAADKAIETTADSKHKADKEAARSGSDQAPDYVKEIGGDLGGSGVDAAANWAATATGVGTAFRVINEGGGYVSEAAGLDLDGHVEDITKGTIDQVDERFDIKDTIHNVTTGEVSTDDAKNLAENSFEATKDGLLETRPLSEQVTLGVIDAGAEEIRETFELDTLAEQTGLNEPINSVTSNETVKSAVSMLDKTGILDQAPEGLANIARGGSENAAVDLAIEGTKFAGGKTVSALSSTAGSMLGVGVVDNIAGRATSAIGIDAEKLAGDAVKKELDKGLITGRYFGAENELQMAKRFVTTGELPDVSLDVETVAKTGSEVVKGAAPAVINKVAGTDVVSKEMVDTVTLGLDATIITEAAGINDVDLGAMVTKGQMRHEEGSLKKETTLDFDVLGNRIDDTVNANSLVNQASSGAIKGAIDGGTDVTGIKDMEVAGLGYDDANQVVGVGIETADAGRQIKDGIKGFKSGEGHTTENLVNAAEIIGKAGQAAGELMNTTSDISEKLNSSENPDQNQRSEQEEKAKDTSKIEVTDLVSNAIGDMKGMVSIEACDGMSPESQEKQESWVQKTHTAPKAQTHDMNSNSLTQEKPEKDYTPDSISKSDADNSKDTLKQAMHGLKAAKLQDSVDIAKPESAISEEAANSKGGPSPVA